MISAVHRRACVIASIALLGLVPIANAMPVVYTLVPVNDGATVLTGSITVVDDTTVGQVFLSEIADWSFSASGAVNFAISKSDPGTSTQCAGSAGSGGPCFTILGSSLVFDFTLVDDPSDVSYAFEVQANLFADVLMKNDSSLYIARTFSPNASIFLQPSGPLVVAVHDGDVAAIPEPATLALLGLGIAGFGIRCRKQAA